MVLPMPIIVLPMPIPTRRSTLVTNGGTRDTWKRRIAVYLTDLILITAGLRGTLAERSWIPQLFLTRRTTSFLCTKCVWKGGGGLTIA